MPKRIPEVRIKNFENAARARARMWALSENEGVLRPEAAGLAYDMASSAVEVHHKGGLSRAAMERTAALALQQAEVWIDTFQAGLQSVDLEI